ncbi:MAG TPA: type II toxin-antitoxin system VapC family toxin [Gemmatimonadota bacterium]|nr:type II toxin-antitoxin system VapC family toxin [Gemmatimonadota bacterium]
MRVLLDTHVWLWMVAEPKRFSPESVALLQDGSNELLLSAASSFEIAIKYTLGKLPLPAPPQEYVPDQIARTGVAPLAIEHAHALAVAELPLHHRDPFDRLLIAQAQLEGLTILTIDRRIAAYDVPIRWAGPIG